MNTNAALIDAFTAPPTAAKSSASMQRLRLRYAQELTDQYGIPTAIAKTLVYTYKSPKAFHRTAQLWTGRCALSGIMLTDRGDLPTSTIIQHKHKRFISKFMHDVMLALNMPEAAFVKMCTAVYTTHHGNIPSAVQQPHMGVRDSEHEHAGDTDHGVGTTRPINLERTVLLGLHSK